MGFSIETSAQTVNAGGGGQLVFTTSAQTLTAVVVSGTMSVQQHDTLSLHDALPILTVNLSSDSTGIHSFRDNTIPATTITTVAIANGASTGSFRYYDEMGGAQA